MSIDEASDELIRPPLARDPEQLCRFIADALGDGDLAAALSYYEPQAVLTTSDGCLVSGTRQIERALARTVAARLDVEVQVYRVLCAGSMAVARADWTLRGSDRDGAGFQRLGAVRSVSRRGRDGGWRVVIEELSETHD